MRRCCLLALLAVFCCLPVAGPAAAADRTPVNFVLDWIVGGRHTGWFAALHKGYFAEEGLDVRISRGYGNSGIQRLASGQNEFSFNDIAIAIVSRVRDGLPVKAVSVSYAKHPSAIFTLKKSNIRSLKDLEGRTLIDSTGSSNMLLFPLLARAGGFDADKVKWMVVAPDAKMQVFLAGKGQGVLFYNMQLPLMEEAARDQGGVDMLVFGDYLSMYSNGILTTDEYLAKHPETVRGFLRASMRGWQFAFQNPDEAVAMLRQDNPLLDARVARAEIGFVKDMMESPEARRAGLGWMDESKMRDRPA